MYLGNLSEVELCERLKIALPDDDLLFLKESREQNCDAVKGNPVWHCYDIPFMIACGTLQLAAEINDILKKYEGQMKGSIQIGVDN